MLARREARHFLDQFFCPMGIRNPDPPRREYISNGIQTRSGRLVIACDHNTRDNVRYSHVIYSDDRGATWKIGGVVPITRSTSRTCRAVQTELNMKLKNEMIRQK